MTDIQRTHQKIYGYTDDAELYADGVMCPICKNDWMKPKRIIIDPYVHDEDFLCEECGHLWNTDDPKFPTNKFRIEVNI